MQDMNDFYVNINCKTKIHIGGYVFTVAELYNNAMSNMTIEELERHKEHK
jgi:hypothetical protein